MSFMDIKEMNTNNIDNNVHPWELSRCHQLLKIIIELKINPIKILDVGAGNLFIAKQLTLLFPESDISCIDSCFQTDEQKGKIFKYKMLDRITENISDLTLMLDVLEHIDNDTICLNQVVKKMKKQSVLILTVPAFQFLYTQHDFFLHHRRRYSLKLITNIIQKSGLKIEKVFYFYFSLFFLRFLQKKFNINVAHVGQWNYSKQNLLTKIITLILNIDFFLCTKFNNKLLGLSICIIASKSS